MSINNDIILFNHSNSFLSETEISIIEYIFGYGLNCLLFIMMVPQIYKAFKYKCTDDISYKFLGLAITAEVFEIIYGILINQLPVLLTGVLLLFQMTLLLYVKTKYDNPKDMKMQRYNSKLKNVATNSKDNNIPIQSSDLYNPHELTEITYSDDDIIIEIDTNGSETDVSV